MIYTNTMGISWCFLLFKALKDEKCCIGCINRTSECHTTKRVPRDWSEENFPALCCVKISDVTRICQLSCPTFRWERMRGRLTMTPTCYAHMKMFLYAVYFVFSLYSVCLKNIYIYIYIYVYTCIIMLLLQTSYALHKTLQRCTVSVYIYTHVDTYVQHFQYT